MTANTIEEEMIDVGRAEIGPEDLGFSFDVNATNPWGTLNQTGYYNNIREINETCLELAHYIMRGRVASNSEPFKMAKQVMDIAELYRDFILGTKKEENNDDDN